MNTVNPEYFVRTQFSYPGPSDLSYAWNFRTVADRCGFSDLLCTFHMHFIFLRKPQCTKYTKITCTRIILDLQQVLELKRSFFGCSVKLLKRRGNLTRKKKKPFQFIASSVTAKRLRQSRWQIFHSLHEVPCRTCSLQLSSRQKWSRMILWPFSRVSGPINLYEVLHYKQSGAVKLVLLRH